MIRVNTCSTIIATLISTLVFSPTVLAKNFRHYNAPLVVDDTFVKTYGNVITGDFVGTTSTPALTVSTSTPVTILNSTVKGPGDLIYATSANIQVLNTIGTGTNPNVYGAQKGKFIHVENAINVDVEFCTFTGTMFGVYVHNYIGDYNHDETITILNNIGVNVDGRESDGNGGYIADGSFKGHSFQLNTVYNVPDIEIAWNQIVNTPYQSQVNDQINIYKSSGTTTSHMRIHDNYLQGSYPANPGVDSYSGAGIITDGTAADTAATATAFVDAFNNQIVSTSHTGMATDAGHDNHFYNNRIVSSGYISNGTFIGGGNGLSNWNDYSQPTTVYFNDYMSTNLVGLIAGTAAAPTRSDWYLAGQTDTGENVDWTPDTNAAPTLADEANEFVLWQKKLALHKKHIGANKAKII